MRNIGIVLFDGTEELDAVGPYEVLAWAARERDGFGNVFTVAEHDGPVHCVKGMRFLPDHTFENAPPLDVIIVPGGIGTKEQAKNPVLLDYVRREAARCEWVTSVCTGMRVMIAAGPAVGKRVTTHWASIEEIRQGGKAREVIEGVRFVRDGNFVSSAGVSAGIDMALWLVGAIAKDPAFARSVQRGIQYDPAPPYTSEA